MNVIRKKLGTVPNILATMAHSPAIASDYLGFNRALAGGTILAPLREQIALAVGQANECEYCVSAHAALGVSAGLTADDVAAARRGDATDERNNAALSFARQLVDSRGIVSDADIEELRLSDFSDGQVTEIVANVAINVFTNYFNHVARTEVDFPAVAPLEAF